VDNIEMLNKDRKLWSKISTNARNLIQSSYSIDSQINAFKKILS